MSYASFVADQLGAHIDQQSSPDITASAAHLSHMLTVEDSTYCFAFPDMGATTTMITSASDEAAGAQELPYVIRSDLYSYSSCPPGPYNLTAYGLPGGVVDTWPQGLIGDGPGEEHPSQRRRLS